MMTDRIYEAAQAGVSPQTVRERLFESCLKHPERKALEWYDQQKGTVSFVTYRELLSDIAKLGTAFYNRGLKGKVLALSGSASYPMVLCLLTALCSDMTAVILDQAMEEEALQRDFEWCGGSIRIAEPFLEVDEYLASGEKLLSAGEENWLKEEIRCSQRALMLFTSGTGGKRKAAVLSQENLTLNIYDGEDCCDKSEKRLLLLPLHHIAGIVELRSTLYSGKTLYLSAGMRALLFEYAYVQPVSCFLVPVQASLLLMLIEDRTKEEAVRLLGGHLTTLRTCGAPVQGEIVSRLMDYGITVTSEYGLTESTGGITVTRFCGDQPVCKQGSAGSLLPNMEVLIDQPDSQGIGEILVRGKYVFQGYYRDPQETTRVLENGSLHTGDMGYIDDDGFLFIVGRKKNVLVLESGEKIIPEEMERELYRISGIRECMVYEKNGIIAAKIYAPLLNGDHDKINGEIKRINNSLPTWKRIRWVDLCEEPLVKTSTGKLLRNKNE